MASSICNRITDKEVVMGILGISCPIREYFREVADVDAYAGRVELKHAYFCAAMYPSNATLRFYRTLLRLRRFCTSLMTPLIEDSYGFSEYSRWLAAHDRRVGRRFGRGVLASPLTLYGTTRRLPESSLQL
jgi:hypothetical protein